MKKHVTKGKLFLGVAGDRVFAGRVDEVTERYIMLRNGDSKQIVYYDQRAVKFQVFEPPAGFNFTMGDSQLQLAGGGS